jgi:Domain of unknown function (DUF4249)
MSNNKIWVILGAFLTLFMSACTNELVLTDTWRDIPVVYGILSTQDTAHYIRLEKAFLDANKGALDVAKIADSLYYKNATVTLEEVISGRKIAFTRADATKEGYPRAAGTFAQTPNYIYKARTKTAALKNGETYRLIINRGDGKKNVTAETQLVKDFVISRPTAGVTLAFRYDADVRLAWVTDVTAAFYDVKVIVHYTETPNDKPTAQIKNAEWFIRRNVAADNTTGVQQMTFKGIEFYQAFAAALKTAPLVRTRQFKNIDIMVEAGGKEMRDYMNIGAANTGVTGAESAPTYTNLSEGYGVFSSRNRAINIGFDVNTETLDSLKNGIYTRKLGFK